MAEFRCCFDVTRQVCPSAPLASSSPCIRACLPACLPACLQASCCISPTHGCAVPLMVATIWPAAVFCGARQPCVGGEFCLVHVARVYPPRDHWALHIQRHACVPGPPSHCAAFLTRHSLPLASLLSSLCLSLVVCLSSSCMFSCAPFFRTCDPANIDGIGGRLKTHTHTHIQTTRCRVQAGDPEPSTHWQQSTANSSGTTSYLCKMQRKDSQQVCPCRDCFSCPPARVLSNCRAVVFCLSGCLWEK